MKFVRRLVLGFVCLAVLTVVAGTWLSRQLLDERFPASLPEPVTVEVPPGTSARAVLAELERRELIRSATAGRLVLKYRLHDRAIQAGEYRFTEPATLLARLQQLTEGQVVLHPTTIIEGLTAAETAAALAEAGLGDEKAFLAAMGDPALIRELDPQASDLEGYLFPDTYSLPRRMSEQAIVATMVRNFLNRHDAVLTELVEAAERETPPRTLRQIVTLASIVEKEAQLDEERPTIAGVYHHRLRRGIALYADPTVIFGLKRQGTWDGNLRKEDLARDTPYNTYVRAGLPPGPICSPGIASLQAAAKPEPTEYLYFVSRNDGSHIFAKTLREHNRNVQTWQKQYWRDRWKREREEKAAG